MEVNWLMNSPNNLDQLRGNYPSPSTSCLGSGLRGSEGASEQQVATHTHTHLNIATGIQNSHSDYQQQCIKSALTHAYPDVWGQSANVSCYPTRGEDILSGRCSKKTQLRFFTCSRSSCTFIYTCSVHWDISFSTYHILTGHIWSYTIWFTSMVVIWPQVCSPLQLEELLLSPQYKYYFYFYFSGIGTFNVPHIKTSTHSSGGSAWKTARLTAAHVWIHTIPGG